MAKMTLEHARKMLAGAKRFASLGGKGIAYWENEIRKLSTAKQGKSAHKALGDKIAAKAKRRPAAAGRQKKTTGKRLAPATSGKPERKRA